MRRGQVGLDSIRPEAELPIDDVLKEAASTLKGFLEDHRRVMSAETIASTEAQIAAVRKVARSVPFAVRPLKRERDRALADMAELRRRHANFLRRIKRMLGLKNWPKIKGDFLNGVARLLEERV